jgi:hypothetical protein
MGNYRVGNNVCCQRIDKENWVCRPTHHANGLLQSGKRVKGGGMVTVTFFARASALLFIGKEVYQLIPLE